ncbi:DEAD/DEAH box helicase [Bacillus pinisoli]|uniref:DEAD/DEAH box helicase n=1 Tax=Bacillus pinisoli TaxID=2901866 RepID=UPI001FF470C9|nr:AAA domain-containing protein [Bacillus pinisoli]
MISTLQYIKEWQQSLQAEIQYLKKYGSTKYHVINGHLLLNDNGFTYYFETTSSIRIPVGSLVKVEWGSMKQEARIKSSEGKSLILTAQTFMGDLISEAVVFHDPWELLEELIERLDECKKSKRKRKRIKYLMEPPLETSHPIEKVKNGVHEVFLRSKYNPVTFLWGPPGTGKTYNLARVAIQHYLKGKRILLLSHSNQAIDVLIAEIAGSLRKKRKLREGDILRYGSQIGDVLSVFEGITTTQLIQQNDPMLAEEKRELIEERQKLKSDLAKSFSKRDTDYLLEIETKLARLLERIRSKEVKLLKDAFIVGTTLAKAASDETIYQKDYDVVMLDEASMAYVPQVGFATTLGKRTIVCGDFKQLPPIAASNHPLVNKWLKQDVFHGSGITESVTSGKLHPQLYLLNEQRRMHPDISAFTNQSIYGSLVSDHLSVKTSRQTIVERSPFPNRGSVLVDSSFMGEYCIVEKSSSSRINLWQLLLSFQLIHEAYIGGSRSIGYATPYRAQAELMQVLLQDLYIKELETSDIIAATVHKFQGSERDVMLFDSVDSFPQHRASMLLTGKESERLINVAVTRTKGKFIHVTDTNFVRKNIYRGKTMRALVEYQLSKQQQVLPSQIGTWVRNQHSRLKWQHALKLDQLYHDLKVAKVSVHLSLPKGSDLPEEWQEKLKEVSKKVRKEIYELLPFPFVIIDQRYLWLGVPLVKMKNLHPPYVAVRLDSEQIAQYVLKQISE